MTLKIVEEITEWAVEYRQPNHVYLMSGDKALAYVPWGKGKPIYFKTFQRLDRRGRKFREVPNRWQFRMDIGAEAEEEVKPRGQTWTVASSKGGEYVVSLDAGRWACTCPGHVFRSRCRHVDELKASNLQPV